MKRKVIILGTLFTALATISAVGFMNAKSTKTTAETLPLAAQTWTNTATGQSVELQTKGNTEVDIAKYQWFGISIEFGTKSSTAYSAFNIKLTNARHEQVVGLRFASAEAYNNAVAYPQSFTVTDWAGCINGNRKGSDKRLNIPTTKEKYFVAQKSAAYYATIQRDFVGTMFFYLPDYTDANFTVTNIEFANNDSTGIATSVSNAFFCERLTKVTSAGFAPEGDQLPFKPIACSALIGTPTIVKPSEFAEGLAVKNVVTPNAETIVSFKNQITVDTETYKFLAVDMNITNPASSGYLNMKLNGYNKYREVTNNFLYNRDKMVAAAAAALPNGLVASDFTAAVGGVRCNIQAATPTDYSRVSNITSQAGLYVPVKSDNAYNYVFKGGASYTTFIYLPDFGISSFDFDALGFSTVGAATFKINAVYLCGGVTKVTNSADSTNTYRPIGSKLNLPMISVQATSGTYTSEARDDLSVVEQFVNFFMAMDSTTENQCLSLYGPAKEAFNSLTSGQKTMFENQTHFGDAKARLAAWATANGDTYLDGALTTAARYNVLGNSDNYVVNFIIVALSLSSIILAAVLMLRKKRHN